MDLVDVPSNGNRFTWSNKVGSCKSRLDRFLLSEGLVDGWKIVGQKVGDMDISDHAPIWLKANDKDWGPKPFRFINCWLEDREFLKFAEDSWKDFAVAGNYTFMLKENLKLLRNKLRIWNKESFGWIDLKIEEAIKVLNSAESQLTGTVDVALARQERELKRKAAMDDLWKHLRLQESLLRQKSRIKWLKEGDQNTRYFHHVVKDRRRRNNIVAVHSTQGVLVEDVNGIQNDIVNFVMEFHTTTFLPKAITASFLALIPKNPNPQGLNEYRPICLVGCLYKIISKILANRIKKVLKSIISPCQSAFVPDRQILDGVLALNEIVDHARKEKKECFIFKVDFQQAYDCVNWGFLRSLFHKFGFGSKWCKWMEACVFNSSMSILVNGSPTKDFWVERGLRQGDPLSPFLFTLVAEGLAMVVQKAAALGRFEGYKIKENLEIRILQFADDTVLVGSGCWEDFLDRASQFLCCSREVFPFKFLGIHVGLNPRRCSSWTPVVSSLKKRLSSWKARMISIRRRVTLLNSVLSSIPVFTMSFYRAPIKIIKEIISIQSRFLRCGNEEKKCISWVSWANICKPKEEGGLGVKHMGLFNKALLCKWKWRILSERGSVWRDILEARYGDLNIAVIRDSDHKTKRKDSVWWKYLCAASSHKTNSFDCFAGNIRFGLGQGNIISFWHGIWIGGSPFKSLFPAAFYLSRRQNGLVCEMGSWQCGLWCWDLDIPGELLLVNPTAMMEVMDLVEILASVKPVELRSEEEPVDESSARALNLFWTTQIPSKLKVFGWRILLDRLPLKFQLARRGIIMNDQDKMCVFCGSEVEDLNHLLFSCLLSKNVWSNVGLWLDIQQLDGGPVFITWNTFLKLLRGKLKRRKFA
ncbi:uncharacterized protein LOC131622352 [Vicia villosa]|uniref:uncharacterized protein LOC131622352 n=1 Tax=Vicia villosa TaxID=3911 RepID=UPI00273B4F67|nr:uncharacterized protein LOC131622352 [Vicia villosa]